MGFGPRESSRADPARRPGVPVATLSAGLYVGAWVHNIVAGDQRQREVAARVQAGPPAASLGDMLTLVTGDFSAVPG